VTISPGVATGPGLENTGAASLLHRADAALYSAKAQWRSRVCAESGVSEPAL